MGHCCSREMPVLIQDAWRAIYRKLLSAGILILE